jgi:hypothetical protein
LRNIIDPMLEEAMPKGTVYFLGVVVVVMIVAGYFGVGQWP